MSAAERFRSLTNSPDRAWALASALDGVLGNAAALFCVLASALGRFWARMGVGKRPREHLRGAAARFGHVPDRSAALLGAPGRNAGRRKMRAAAATRRAHASDFCSGERPGRPLLPLNNHPWIVVVARCWN